MHHVFIKLRYYGINEILNVKGGQRNHGFLKLYRLINTLDKP